jgi:hypothetical protein
VEFMSSETIESTTTDTPADGDHSERQPPTESDRTFDGSEREQVAVEYAPPRLGQVLSIAAGIVGAGLTTPFVLLALPFGVTGVVALGAGLFLTHSRRWISVGTSSILFGAILTGAYGAVSTELILIGSVSTVLAWDAGRQALSIGQQLGRDTESRRAQLVHVAASAVVLGTVAVFAYAISLVAEGAGPRPLLVSL